MRPTCCIIAAIIIQISTISSHAEPLSRSTTQRDQPTTRFYDSRGNSTGTASTNSSGTTTFYDARGNVVGHHRK
jgi:YD repeat-containing protein